MKKELEGFVLGSKAREKVLLILAKGHVLDGETIARKGRIVHSVCVKTLDELEEKGLITGEWVKKGRKSSLNGIRAPRAS